MHTFAQQVAHEGPHRRELARRRAACLPLRVQLREEAAQCRPIELRRIQIALLQRRLGRHIADELRQIALVGAHRVRRRVAVQREKLQEVLEMFDHRGRTTDRSLPATGVTTGVRAPPVSGRVIHASRSASARVDNASLRSFLPFGGASSGGMIPNVMFDGS